MFDWIVIITTIIGSLLLSRVFNSKQKMWLVPFCIMYSMGLVTTAGSIGGFAHFMFTVWNFVVVMVLCNGFPSSDWKGNPVWKAFLFFGVYMFIIVFTGYFPIIGACRYINEFVTTFAAGYFLSCWMCKNPNALNRVQVFVLIAAWFAIIYAIRHGGLNPALLDASGRAALDSDSLEEGVTQNVNHTALTLSCLLPFLVTLMLKPAEKIGESFVKWAASAAFVIIVLMIIRTGSRNGALAFIPCIWYFFNASKKKGRLAVQIFLAVFIFAAIAVGLKLVMRNASSIRAFDFLGQSGAEIYETAGDALTSGRISMYKSNLDNMSVIEKLVGKGFMMSDNVWSFDRKTGLYVKNRKLTSGNAHSMYMTVFYRSGFIGVFLFVVFLVKAIRQGLRLGNRGRIGLVFLGVWLMTGVGEAWGMIGGHSAILAGIAMGLFTNNVVQNPELMTERDKRLAAARGWW